MLNKNIKSPVNIPVEKIRPFEGHPYKVLDNEEMNFLIESIQQQGIISPVVVRPLENTKIWVQTVFLNISTNMV